MATANDKMMKNTQLYYRLEAVVYLHIRGILVSREILNLMKSGFADGAMGRWRTLHELAVVSSFISNNSEEISIRFFEARHVQSKKAARQYQEYHKRAKLVPYSDEELGVINDQYERVISTYGEEMKYDFGWAAPELGKKNPNFFDLEKSQKSDHWRPRYKWSCQDNHPNYRPLRDSLAMAEISGPVLLIGPSNAGMTEIGHMLGISLELVTRSFKNFDPSPDLTNLYQTFQRLSEQTYNKFKIGEKRTKL